MIKRFAILISALAAITAPLTAAELRSFSAVPDLYLMDGMTEADAESLSFDKPGGRIVTAAAYGPVESGALLHFYHDVLPALGWIKTGQTSYEREGEALTLAISEVENHQTRLEIMIEPVQQNP